MCLFEKYRMKLKWIINIGRYRNKDTGKEYNIKKGKRPLRGTTRIFYLYRNTKVFIEDNDFYSNYERVVNNIY